MKRKMNNDFGFEMLPLPNQQEKLTRKDITMSLYDYKLYGEITEAENYIDLIDALRYSSPNDEFVIRINSGGGLLSTGNTIINAIKESPAHVHGYIESECGSCATFVFLACDSHGFADDIEFFTHTASSGSYGKEHENFARATFSRKRIHRLIKETYAGLLTEQESQNVLNGQDYYFDKEELQERLENYYEYQETLRAIEEQEFLDEINGFEDEESEDRDNDQLEIKVVKKKKILPS